MLRNSKFLIQVYKIVIYSFSEIIVYINIYLYIKISIYLSTYLSIYLYIYLSINIHSRCKINIHLQQKKSAAGKKYSFFLAQNLLKIFRWSLGRPNVFWKIRYFPIFKGRKLTPPPFPPVILRLFQKITLFTSQLEIFENNYSIYLLYLQRILS